MLTPRKRCDGSSTRTSLPAPTRTTVVCCSCNFAISAPGGADASGNSVPDAVAAAVPLGSHGPALGMAWRSGTDVSSALAEICSSSPPWRSRPVSVQTRVLGIENVKSVCPEPACPNRERAGNNNTAERRTDGLAIQAPEVSWDYFSLKFSQFGPVPNSEFVLSRSNLRFTLKSR
jgi:hypothetical protein